MDKKRILTFDIAKGIGVFLVILGHMEVVNPVIRDYITTFHMPLFFVISGMLLYRNGSKEHFSKEYILNKVNTLLVPYLGFSILIIGLEAVYSLIRGRFSLIHILDYIYQTISMNGISVLWFLSALFFGLMLFIGIQKSGGTIFTVLLSFVLMLLAYLGSLYLARLEVCYGDSRVFAYLQYKAVIVLRVFFCNAFICMGYYLRPVLECVKVGSIKNLFIGIAMFLVVGFVAKENGRVDLHYLVFGNFILYLLGAVMGSMGVLFLCRYLEDMKKIIPLRIFAYFGKNSLTVMATHLDFYVMQFSIVIATQIKRLANFSNDALYGTLIFVILCMVEWFLIEMINRFAPLLLGRKK